MEPVICAACGRTCGEFDLRCAGCGEPLATAPAGSGPGADPGPGSAEPEPLSGRQVSHFLVHELLGRGGMGAVYRATDLTLGRAVALKVLPGRADDPDEQERLRREARAAAALDHPNVGTVYEVGEHEGRPFIAMAFYEGETLAARLARGPLPLAAALDVARQVAAALAAAHRAGVVHRDVKPGNVLLPAGGPVKLVDFGVARRLDSTATSAPGRTAGTLAYMAPEQVCGDPVDFRTDLWALGLLLHESLAGVHPFAPAPGRGFAGAILEDDPPPLAGRCPEVPAAVADLVRRCLAKDPASRPPSAGSAAALLEGELAALSGAWRPAAALPGQVPARSRLWATAAGLALVAALAVGIVAARRPAGAVGHLAVGVLAPRVTGALTAEESALVAANLQEAALRGLTALAEVAPVDPGQMRAVSGSPARVARAVAAGELVATEATCAADLCQVALRRLSGEDGRVVRTVSLQLSPSNPRAFAEGVAVGVRRAYPDRELRWDSGLGLAVADEDYDRYLRIRRRLSSRERPTAAMLDELEALRGRAPGFAEAAFLEAGVARVLFAATGEAGYLDRGLAVAREAEARFPDDPRPPASHADLALAAGRLDEAEEALGRLDRLEPGSATADLRRAQLLEARGRPGEALPLLRRVVERQPSWQYLIVLANLEYRQGHLAEARAALDRLLARVPDNAEGLRTLAQIELLDGDPARAVALLRRLSRGAADSSDLANLGVALLLLRRYAEAEPSLRRARELSPEDPQMALNLADCLLLLGRREEAARVYGEVVALTRGEEAAALWAAQSARAQALAHLRRGPEAVEAAQRALRLTPDNPQLALEAAVVYAVLGERSSALAQAERALGRGVDRRWFGLPWFDALRPELAATGSPPDRATR